MPTRNFCTGCGSPMTECQKFCTTCGKSVDSRTPATYANTTSPQANSLRSASDPVANAAPGSSSSKRIVFATLFTLISVIALVAILFATGVFKASDTSSEEADIPSSEKQTEQSEQSDETLEPDNQTQTDNTATSASESPATSADSTTTSSEPTLDRSESAAYDKLLVLYDDLGNFDQRITEAAQRFNENYLSPDYETRFLYAEEAENLLADINKSYGDLYSTTVSPHSPNASVHEALDICYEDCVQRISVISEAWNISLSCEDPSIYRDEILAPIARDNENGVNRYYAEFQEVYPTAQPVKP